MAGRKRNVALLIETSNAYARGLLQGIIGYIQDQPRWTVDFPEISRGELPSRFLSGWTGDGMIARIETPSIARAVTAQQCPVVDVSAARHVPSVPWVETNDEAIARLAVDHFLERGFRSVAFAGDRRFNWSRWRCEHFQQYATAAGCSCQLFDMPRTSLKTTGDTARQQLAGWIRSLPKPVGILACYDHQARHVLTACREAQLQVPDEVAVLGVDNDEFLCNLTSPALSSVIPDTFRTGFEAARLLDRMMSGRKVKPQAHLIAPLGIETRQSTDVLAVDDPEVAAAVRFIREHYQEAIQVRDILDHVALSRRILESRFRRSLGRTPHEEIQRLRIARVQELLRQTDLSVALIARRTGFQHAEYMTVAFRRATGTAPTEYRRRHRPTR